MKYFSMFTGVGGFELGIKQAHSNKQSAEIEQDKEGRNRNSDEGRGNVCSTDKSPLCVGFSEIDKHASKLLKNKFPEIKNYGNARDINPKELVINFSITL